MNELLGYLPAHVEGTLVALMNEAPPVLCPSEEQASLDFRRSFGLQRVHRLFEESSHDNATAIIAKAWERKSDFGLLLRNFSLGGKTNERTKDLVLTSVSTKALRLERILVEQCDDRLPLVAIQNPAFDGTGKLDIPKLSFADDQWQNVAKCLIAAARLIVLHFSALTSGVIEELEYIKTYGRQDDTVLIVDENGRQELLSDVISNYNVVHVYDEESWAASKIIQLLLQEQPYNRAFGVFPSLSSRPCLPEEIRSTAKYVAGAAMLEAFEHAQKGEVLLGENALVRCIVLCCFCGYDEGRARGYLELARAAFFGRNNISFSRIYYDCAIETYSRLSKESETSKELLRAAHSEFMMLRGQ